MPADFRIYLFSVIFITLGTGLTRSVCSYVHGQDCGDLAYIIQAGLGLVYVAAGYFSGAVDVTLPIRRDIDNGGDTGIHAEYRDWLHDAIDASSGLSFDDITSLPFDPALAALAKRDTADPDLVTRVQITGLRVSNGTSTTPAQDVVVNLFADNTTVLHLPVISSSSYPTDGLGKRVNSPGFKISFTTRIPSKLSYTHMQEMALVGAMDWGSAAGQYPMNEWIGLAKTNHDANFYYRIIPETFSMDYSYESVDICGQMGVYL
ncbi:hypothetical protein QBC33DRAFT_534344 [Phialemonium atrogriseum]|uniref:Uncharacterized protein n=1 Tax=Phialemonium atrogriseum TaxID=1093897 RepID=A0AAJ0FQB1_9PEZI|nr:uncharacterized protein QBC33DRAFT_534344 [Phialemonium atrogriseum]KAK1768975.1 hypothetical protein QBC33DRAFT_534344 [Phialemonium atrogriseum]